MIRRDLTLKRCDWRVCCYIGYESDDAVYLCQELTAMGCRGEKVREAFEHFMRGGHDSGLTYSNKKTRSSMVAIGCTDSRGGEVNTIGHELLHVVAHVCEADGIDMQGEEPCYMLGELCEKMFDELKSYEA